MLAVPEALKCFSNNSTLVKWVSETMRNEYIFLYQTIWAKKCKFYNSDREFKNNFFFRKNAFHIFFAHCITILCLLSHYWSIGAQHTQKNVHLQPIHSYMKFIIFYHVQNFALYVKRGSECSFVWWMHICII